MSLQIHVYRDGGGHQLITRAIHDEHLDGAGNWEAFPFSTFEQPAKLNR